MGGTEFNWDTALFEMQNSVVCRVSDWWHLLGIPALLAIPIWLPYYLLMRKWKREGKDKALYGTLTKFSCYLITLKLNLLMLEGVCNRDYCDINRIIGDIPDFLVSLGISSLCLYFINRKIQKT